MHIIYILHPATEVGPGDHVNRLTMSTCTSYIYNTVHIICNIYIYNIHISYIPHPRSSRRWGPAMVYNRTWRHAMHAAIYCIHHIIFIAVYYIFTAPERFATETEAPLVASASIIFTAMYYSTARWYLATDAPLVASANIIFTAMYCFTAR